VGGIGAAGRDSFQNACKLDTIAPHIPVLTRDIPFILNITVRPEHKKTLPVYPAGLIMGIGLGENA